MLLEMLRVLHVIAFEVVMVLCT